MNEDCFDPDESIYPKKKFTTVYTQEGRKAEEINPRKKRYLPSTGFEPMTSSYPAAVDLGIVSCVLVTRSTPELRGL